MELTPTPGQRRRQNPSSPVHAYGVGFIPFNFPFFPILGVRTRAAGGGLGWIRTPRDTSLQTPLLGCVSLGTMFWGGEVLAFCLVVLFRCFPPSGLVSASLCFSPGPPPR